MQSFDIGIDYITYNSDRHLHLTMTGSCGLHVLHVLHLDTNLGRDISNANLDHLTEQVNKSIKNMFNFLWFIVRLEDFINLLFSKLSATFLSTSFS